jgi:NAD(P)H-hydrate epimerase
MMDVQIPADLPRLPPRAADSHKGDYGRALLIGGSRGMSGAIALAGMACLRAGAGLVKLAVPDCCLETVAGFNPCYMTVPLESDDGQLAASARDKLEELASEATCVAIGPGLGKSGEVNRLVRSLYRTLEKPMVIDADGLNALAASKSGLAKPGGPRVLTPHPGELARLAVANGLSDDESQRHSVAVELAARHQLVVVLKGHRTLITDGHEQQTNTTGNPGMATGGTGDVLTGIITALICQELSPLDAARLGVFVHGLAGDLAAEQRGQTALIATDLVEHLPQAWRKLAW